jgi:site-specific DNA-methyltransferase (adenine-specific)
MKKFPKVIFSSESEEWLTPDPLFETLDAEFHFTLDPCATPLSARCAAFYTKADDGLKQPWLGTVFVNPPYGRNITLWIEKAYEESQAGSTVVCLVPARTDTNWWHDFITRAAELRFIRGRLNFDRLRNGSLKEAGTHNATFPSVVAVFRPGVSWKPDIRWIDRQGEEIPPSWDVYLRWSDHEWAHMTDEEREAAIREQAMLYAELDCFEARKAGLA